jgi:hypothetical protein
MINADKFTPGPWTADIEEFWHHGIEASSATIIIVGDKDDKHDDAGVRGATDEEAEANARLIAAAPDLLDALRAMVDRWEPDTDGADRRMWENARAAIAKATTP